MKDHLWNFAKNYKSSNKRIEISILDYLLMIIFWGVIPILIGDLIVVVELETTSQEKFTPR